MDFKKELLNKISIAEALTLTFILSVGLSLLYKYGFYYHLGVEWYLNSISPQQILLSSVGLVFTSLLGVILGISMTLLSRKYFELSFAIFVIIWLMFFVVNLLGYQFIASKFIMLMVYTLTVSSIVKINLFSTDSEGRIISSIPWEDRKITDKVTPLIITVISVIGLLGMTLFQGKVEAEDILKNPNARTLVKVKGESEVWELIDINGDKVLLLLKKPKLFKAEQLKPTYKIIEYKEIEKYKSN
ncbi:hypothetical protein KWE42_08430 [Acinetobacter pittii]|uniref:hypothetical protein n=1 Tax=Acinetobacter TaxID=469 RepID=UPI0002F454A7|nr:MULTISPECIES: hypothetical protein [Acinetobacter]KQG03770.1 hypothetical protein APC29_17805 [Acinetobacter pittii]MBN6494047.1 hypothetical protein [Acinetobacter pittii]MCU4619164.1 hypothetical protein [Acinetobacter pittii]